MWLPTMQTQAVSEYLRKNENFPDTAHAFSYGVQVEFFLKSNNGSKHLVTLSLSAAHKQHRRLQSNELTSVLRPKEWLIGTGSQMCWCFGTGRMPVLWLGHSYPAE